MGCDIHGVIERRVNGKWITINTLPTVVYTQENDKAFQVAAWSQRNYDRFGALAGVRQPGPPAKGLPDDISETTKYFVDQWGSDGHSHSYLPVTEAAQIFKETGFNSADLISPEYLYFGVESDDGFDDHRFVFWFDN